MRPIVPVILSGGSGQRLWPVSREQYPKQLIALFSDRSLLQDTAARLSGSRFAPPLVVCSDDHRFIVAEQLREIGIDARAIVLEPSGRNTAPAAALGALLAAREDPDAVLAVAPSDHLIANPDNFLAALDVAAAAAGQGKLVTFGVTPRHASTAYGYIKKSGAIDGAEGAFAVHHFAEKPDAGTAEEYLASGDYLWNSGIFVFTAAGYLTTLGDLCPDIVSACRDAINGGSENLDFFRPDAQAFDPCPAESIDRAVMERTAAGAVVPVEMGWHDVGSWVALWELGEKDADGNVRIGDVIASDVRDSYLRSEGPVIAAVGLSDVFIVATRDAVLAVSKGAVEGIRVVVERLRQDGRTEHLTHPRVYRPWGWYETLEVGAGYQVKHLMVKPGHGISLQAHERRAEHWVVVAGNAQVTRGDKVIELGENDSTYLPVGMKHRLENPADEPLSVIEVQLGNYLGEDDIVRFEDRYGRE